MEKVLIISYYYPPCNLTASQRIKSWERYLPQHGFYPIIVTRHWTGNELSEQQRLTPDPRELEIIKKENSEVHFLPYLANLRDFFFVRKKNNPLFNLLSKTLTLLNILMHSFYAKSTYFYNLYTHADKLLRADKSIKLLIISVDPFEQFFFGYLLKRSHPHIKWIADYRDEWTSSSIDKFALYSLQRWTEKKWLSNASLIISVSPHYIAKLSDFLGIKGLVIFNGYDELEKIDKSQEDSFRITYNGTLYDTQPIAIFLKGFILFINENPEEKIQIYFPGLSFKKEQAVRVEKILKGYENYFSITDRVAKTEVLEIQYQSDFLLMVGHQDIKGIPSSKVFEYIGIGKRFIVCPGDNDVLDEIALQSKLGITLNSENEVFSFLQEKLAEKKSGNKTENIISNDQAREQFSVKNQVSKLAEALKNLIREN